MNVGRIVASVQIGNLVEASKTLRCNALVDTVAFIMVLPRAWKERLGDLEFTRSIVIPTETNGILKGEVWGPVRIQIEGFRPICSEVLFAEAKAEDTEYEALIGTVVLAQSQARIDSVSQNLIPIKHMDLKCLTNPREPKPQQFHEEKLEESYYNRA